MKASRTTLRRMVTMTIAVLALIGAMAPGVAYTHATSKSSAHSIQTVFLIVMENKNWSQIRGSSSAPYINSLLVRSDASYATQYFNPPSYHPSEPNYVWLEAGSNTNLPNANTGGTVSFTTDNDPSSANSTSTTDHLVTYLSNAGISWRAYEE